MARLEALAAWFFSCLGIVLLGVSILVVPANAFADAGSDCINLCTVECGADKNCYNSCVGGCCATACSGDPVCGEQCCNAACMGDPTCMNACLAAQGKFCNVKPVYDCSDGGRECRYDQDVGGCISNRMDGMGGYEFCSVKVFPVSCGACECKQKSNEKVCECKAK
jgi:hypothetical protein